MLLHLIVPTEEMSFGRRSGERTERVQIVSFLSESNSQVFRDFNPEVPKKIMFEKKF